MPNSSSMTQVLGACRHSEENPRSSSDLQPTTHLFCAKKSGRRSPLSHLRFFVCDAYKREISYWKTEAEAMEGDRSKRRGVVKVKRASASDSKAARNAAAKAACVEAAGSQQHTPRLQRHNASRSSTDGDGLCRCSVNIEDDNGRTFHLKSMSKHDVDLVVDIFSVSSEQWYKNALESPLTASEGMSDEDEEHSRSNSLEYVQSQFDKYRESQSKLSEEELAAQAKKDKEYAELNSVRTELRDRGLDTIGRKQDLQQRLLRAKAKEDHAANKLNQTHPRLVESFALSRPAVPASSADGYSTLLNSRYQVYHLDGPYTPEAVSSIRSC